MQRIINSPYIVRLVGVIDEPECQAIVMDYFENGSLKSFLKYLDCDCWARRIRMLCDIAIGVNYLHNLTPPIVHKDLKACNIFIDHGLKAKVRFVCLFVFVCFFSEYSHYGQVKFLPY